MLDRVQRSREALVRSEKLALAGLLAARVAHDIRNPLSSIKMQTQLLQSKLRGHVEDEALLDAVRHDIDQVESVIRGLIELARPGELTLRPTGLNDSVRAVLQHLSPQLTYRKIVVDARLDSDLPPIALDAGRFTQALTNVLVNAAEAMPTGGTLAVSTSTAPDGSTVLVDVCDDGTGIDPAVADRLFDPFVSTKRDGVGLGLVNTKAIVESHGGRITLAARDQKGTRARISLPIRGGPRPATAADGSHG